jgi:hypothetical protein
MSFTHLSSLLGGPINPQSLPGFELSPTPQIFPHQWIAVRPRFQQFHRELGLTPLQHSVVGQFEFHAFFPCCWARLGAIIDP